MPRLPRLDDPGSVHHVMNRGARRARVFGDDDTYPTFLDILSTLPVQHGVRIHAFALMPNHFHLLVTAGPRGLAPALQRLQGGYSRWLNRTRRWDGPAWRGRYRSRRIEHDDYLRHVLAYIHLNPVVGGLAPTCDRSLWTSHPHYTGASPAPAWLSPLSDVVGSPEAYRRHLEAVQLGHCDAPEEFDDGRLWTPTRRAPPRRRPAPKPAAPLSLQAAWKLLERVTGSPRTELVRRSRGQQARWQWWLTMWWLPRATGLRGSEVAVLLEAHPSAVSRANRRVHELAAENSLLQELLVDLSARLVG